MKKKLCTILLIFCFISAQATDLAGTNRYISPTGNDASDGLTPATAYATLGKAASVAVSGDVIIAAAGTYTQTTQISIWREGVSFIGAGAWVGGTRINLSYTVTGSNGYNQAAIQLVTASVNNNIGNQSITGVWFDGSNFACYNGILVRCRSNVIFDRCRFTNFAITALVFNGKSSNATGTPPAIFSQGNQVTNCTFTNCSDRITQAANSISAGSISYSGQRNLLIQYDTLINTGKAMGHNGNLFGAVQGNNIGVRFLNNIMTKPADEGNQFNFMVESWYDQGGSEFAYNTCTGGGNHLDIGYGGANRGDSVRSWYIHDNYFSNPALLTANPGVQPTLNIAIQFESSTNITFRPQNATQGDALIENNYCYRIGTFIQIGLSNYAGDRFSNLTVTGNVLDQMGYANNAYSAPFMVGLNLGTAINNIFIYNNTIVGNTTNGSATGTPGPGAPKGILILQSDAGTISDVYFRNNIAMNGFGYGYLVFRGSVACNRIWSQNNILKGNAFTDNPYYFPGTPLPTNFTNTGNLKVDPLFVSSVPVIDYHLKTLPSPGSPGISGGLLPTAYTNSGYYIGAYPVTVANAPPIANAGANKNITLPVNFFTQVGSGTDADGTISSYAWTRISGPGSFNIVSPTSATTDINNLVAGTYVFQLQVTDNGGLTASDQMTVVVNPTAPANVPPSASAGGNKTITLPTNSVTQVGSGTDTDGTITGYSWAYTSGPATYTIVSPNSATTTINNLVAGVYQFTLTVTDNLGATGTSTATIIVNAAANVNPSANAGVNQTITYPTVSTTLNGSGLDSDGTITGYSWAKISGGVATITNSSSASTTVTGMAVGVYQFQLTVIDNSGGTATDVMQVTVNKGNATIGFSAPTLTQVYTGFPLSPTVTTNPAGLSYSLTLGGVTGGKTNVGSYPAIAGITDPNWNFTPASATFQVTKATAVINATSKTVNYDGNPQSITATTTPNVTGLTYLYNGSATPPTAIGTYSVDITLVNANYQATPVNVTLTIVSNPAIIFISDTTKIYNGSAQNVTVTSAWPYTLTGAPQTNAGVYPGVTATINDGIHTGSATATLTIAKQPAVLAWVQPAAIPYGSLLTTSILNATSNISGTWTYNYPLGTVLPIGVTSVTGTFTPTDPANYTGGSISVPISVFGVNPFLDYFISGNGKFFFIEQ